MNLQLVPTVDADRERVERFLREIFQSPEDVPAFRAAQMRWKYYEPRPDWDAPRSYVYQTAEADIVAHACAWPFSLQTASGSVSGVHPIDWAAGTQVPGGGALLLREMRVLREICCCIGGSDVAQKVIAMSGFKPAGEFRRFARPLRPWRQALKHPRRNWKLPARTARNAMWAMRRASAPAGWSATLVAPAGLPPALFPNPQPGIAVAVRSAALFEFMFKCPVARYELYELRNGTAPRGYFVLSFVPGEARIADAWIHSASVDDWRAVAALAVEAALADTTALEMTTAACLPEACAAFEASGFRHYETLPIMMFDRGKRLAGIERYHLQMLDNDFSFLHASHVT
jgi:hypothetical protein